LLAALVIHNFWRRRDDFSKTSGNVKRLSTPTTDRRREHDMNLPFRFLAIFIAASIPALCIAQVTNPEVTQENIKQTICVPGWTKTIRPPTSYTNRIKVELVQATTDATDAVEDYELDHIIPLAVGGHPTSSDNLALQLWDGPDGAHAKDVVEVRMKRLVCLGKISLAKAQACFINGWKTCPTKKLEYEHGH
jgi:hypothetical protein